MKAKIFTMLAVFLLCGLAVTYDLRHKPDAAPAPSAAITAITATAAPAPQNSASLPDFSFKTLDGHVYRIRALPEKAVILHLWASWCAPCIAEFPALLRQVRQAQGNVALVAVSIDDNRDAMARFIARLPPPRPPVYWVWDENKAISLKIFNTIDVPETILIDASGNMAGKIVGDPGWDKSGPAGQLTALFKGKSE